MSEVQKTKMSRGLRWLLIGSVVLNVLFVGFFVAGAFAAKKVVGRFGPDVNGTFALVRALEREDRRAIMTKGHDFKPPKPSRQSTDEFIALIAAEPFDADALREALYAAGQNLQSRGYAVSDALVARIAEMSQAERAVYIERIKEQRDKHKRRKGHKNK